MAQKKKKSITEPQFMAPPKLSEQELVLEGNEPYADPYDQATLGKVDAPGLSLMERGLGAGVLGTGALATNNDIMSLLKQGASTSMGNLKGGIDATITNLGAAAANPAVLYPIGVTADMVMKGLDEPTRKKFVEAYNQNPSEAIRMFGSELGKSATGETLTREKGPNAGAPAGVSSFIQGLLGGVGKGIGSAVDYTKESIAKPLFRGAQEAVQGATSAGPVERMGTLQTQATEDFINKAKNDLTSQANSDIEALQKKLSNPNIDTKTFKETLDEINAKKAALETNLQSIYNQAGVISPEEKAKISVKDAQGQPLGVSNQSTGIGESLKNTLFDIARKGLPLLQAAVPLSPQYAAINADEEKIQLANQLAQEKASKKAGVNPGALDLASEQGKELTRWMAASKDVDDVKDKIDFAIKTGDPSIIALVVNKLAGISSVAIQQGVVSDEEARRVLGGVMSNYNTVQAGGFQPKDVQRMLSSDTWKSAKNFAGVVNDGLKARMGTYRDIYDIPNSFFNKAKIDLSTPKASTAGSITEENVVTQAEQDKANFRANAISKLLQGASTTEGVKQLINGAVDALGIDKKWRFNATESLDSNKVNQAIDAMYEADKVRMQNQRLQKGVQALTQAGYSPDEAMKLLNGTGSAPAKPSAPGSAPKTASSGLNAQEQIQYNNLKAMGAGITEAGKKRLAELIKKNGGK